MGEYKIKKFTKQISSLLAAAAVAVGASGNSEIQVTDTSMENTKAVEFLDTAERIAVPEVVRTVIGTQAPTYYNCEGCGKKTYSYNGDHISWKFYCNDCLEEMTPPSETVETTTIYADVSVEYDVVLERGSGDVNRDGSTDITDMTKLSLYLIGDVELYYPHVVDINKDGSRFINV